MDTVDPLAVHEMIHWTRCHIPRLRLIRVTGGLGGDRYLLCPSRALIAYDGLVPAPVRYAYVHEALHDLWAQYGLPAPDGGHQYDEQRGRRRRHLSAVS